MWVGGKPAEQPYVLISQICTMFYFVYFLVVLPMMGRFEVVMKLPESISRAVLGAKANLGGGPIPGSAAAKPMEKA
jgi:ubiquinol-cytochrome c reductase cytochrome b subunit